MIDRSEIISVIVPVYNEEKNIESLLDNLESLDGNFEVIFSDGGCTDNTVRIIENRIPDINKIIEVSDYSCKKMNVDKYRIIKSEKGRANQMNNGAKISIGESLFFLHCDSKLETDVIKRINLAAGKGIKFGCLKLRFESDNLIMKLCGIMSNLRVRTRKIAFGDQGIFINRMIFFDNDGYKNIPLMEDYQLSIDMKKKYPVVQINSIITTSAIRFEKNGRLKTMYRMQVLQKMYRDGKDIEKIAAMYK